MILGGVCTRRCTFCAVEKGVPGQPDTGEPRRLARAVNEVAHRREWEISFCSTGPF